MVKTVQRTGVQSHGHITELGCRQITAHNAAARSRGPKNHHLAGRPGKCRLWCPI